MAVNKEVIRTALESLMKRLDADVKVKVYEKNYLEPAKVENPFKDIKEAWSQVVNVKMVAKNFDALVQMIIEYGPSSVEIIGPPKSQLSVREAQDILNNVAAMMHRYAAAGVGGTIIVHGKQ
jgi:hypothetical protein